MPFATEGDGDNPEGGTLGESVGVGLELENKLSRGHPRRTTKEASAVLKTSRRGDRNPPVGGTAKFATIVGNLRSFCRE